MADDTQEKVVTKFKGLTPEKQKALLGKMTSEQKTKLKSYLQAPKTPPAPEMSLGQKAGEVAKGFGKGALQTGQFLEKGIVEYGLGIPATPKAGREAYDKLLESKNKYQTGGKVAEMGAEFLATAGMGGAAAVEKLPSTGRALESLERVRDVMKTADIGWQGPAKIAERGSMAKGGSKVMENFFDRVTRPGATRLAFDEARGFLQDAKAELYSKETLPSVKGHLAEFVKSLEGEVTSAAQKAGVLEKYQGFMKEYHAAKNFDEGLSKLKDLAVKKIIPYAAYAYIAEKLGGAVIKGAMGGFGK